MPNDDDQKTGDEKKFSQAELEKVIDSRLAREKEKQEKLRAEAEKAAADKEAAEKARQEAEEARTKLAEENLKAIEAAKEEAKSELRQEFDNKLRSKDLEILKKDLIADHAKGLMPSLKALIKGESEEEILSSINALQAQQAKDLEAMQVKPKNFGNPGTPRQTDVETIKKSDITPSNMLDPKMRQKILAAQREGRVVDG